MLLTYKIYESENNTYSIYENQKNGEDRKCLSDNIQDLVEEIIDVFLYDLEEDEKLTLFVEYNSKDNVHKYMHIDNLEVYFEDCPMPTWENYCKEHNPKFYYDYATRTIEDYDDHGVKFSDIIEKTCKKWKEKLKKHLEKEFSIDNPIYMIKLEKDNDGYAEWTDGNVIIIENTETKEEETVVLKYDYNSFYTEELFISGIGDIKITGPSYEKHIKYNREKFTKAQIDEIRKEVEFVQAPFGQGSSNLVLVDVETNGYIYKLSFGTWTQFGNAWGDDFDDAPYECNAGSVYPEYVTKTVEWMPKESLTVQPIEEYLNLGAHGITKLMFLKGILPALVITDELKNDRYRTYEYPIFLGKSEYEIYRILNQFN